MVVRPLRSRSSIAHFHGHRRPAHLGEHLLLPDENDVAINASRQAASGNAPHFSGLGDDRIARQACTPIAHDRGCERMIAERLSGHRDRQQLSVPPT
jgi:hypothetical protein